MQIVKKNIRNLGLDDLEAYFNTLGEKKFRAKQVYEWLWQKHAHSFESMTNLSKELRAKLNEHFDLPALKVDATEALLLYFSNFRILSYDFTRYYNAMIPAG